MSSVTSMVIITRLSEDEAMARLNLWCAENDQERHQQFEQLDRAAAGGYKFISLNVWAMGGNYFPHWDLAEAFPTFGWWDPENAILIVSDEHGDEVDVYRAKG